MMAIGATTWRVSTVGAAPTSTGGGDGDGGQERHGFYYYCSQD